MLTIPAVEKGQKAKPNLAKTALPPEYSESGEPIYREKERERGFELAIGDTESIEAISSHIEWHVGKIDSVFHELVSDLVHVDVHRIKPSKKKPYYTLVTSGMSDRPMRTPKVAEVSPFAELCISLPKDWPMSEESFKDERNYWPIRWLKMLARFPHEYETWLGFGHTMPNGDPAQPLDATTEMCCWLILPPVLHSNEFCELKVNTVKTIEFFALVPLYREEMELKLKQGAEPLMDRFDKHGINELLDIKRPNVCKRK
jgi:hypothetical protein